MEHLIAALLAPLFRFIVVKPVILAVRRFMHGGPAKRSLLEEWRF